MCPQCNFRLSFLLVNRLKHLKVKRLKIILFIKHLFDILLIVKKFVFWCKAVYFLSYKALNFTVDKFLKCMSKSKHVAKVILPIFCQDVKALLRLPFAATR